MVGCNNPKIRPDYAHIELMKKCIANDIVVIASGCSAQAAAKAGLMDKSAKDLCGITNCSFLFQLWDMYKFRFSVLEVVNSHLDRMPAGQKEKLIENEIAPRAIDREVSTSLHMAHMGCSSLPNKTSENSVPIMEPPQDRKSVV